ncbi:MAG: GC-type dockerin domain-anchored protein [Phycisphaerales bacterium]
MKTKKATVTVATILTACASTALAGGGNPGPDVIVGGLTNINYYGQANVGGTLMAGYAVGTDACNIGTQVANWVDNSVNHPVIAQNLYRLRDGRLEQLGLSWLKHSFASLQDNTCGQCQGNGDFQHLGVMCSDTYDASLNGGQSGLGPRFEVNASNGVFPWPYSSPGGATGNAPFKRIQVPVADLDTGGTLGDQYFMEGQYATRDDALAGNQFNNASYRRSVLLSTFAMSNVGSTFRERPAIFAWLDHGNGPNMVDNSVVIETVILPGDGKFDVAAKVTDLGNGTWRYDYNLHNQNSHRSAGSISIPTGGANLSNLYFHAPKYHSGEPVDNVAWTSSEGANSITWATQAWSAANDQSANAVRWATMYTYSFVADTPPEDGTVTIGLFRPGGDPSFDVTLPVPSAAEAGCNGADLGEPFGQLDFTDVTTFLVAFSNMAPEADLAAPFGQWDFSDVTEFLVIFGAGCP